MLHTNIVFSQYVDNWQELGWPEEEPPPRSADSAGQTTRPRRHPLWYLSEEAMYNYQAWELPFQRNPETYDHGTIFA